MGPAESGNSNELITILSQRVVGQPRALHHIVPYVQMFQAGLAPSGRPIGIFLLLGPTGTGKTRTVEVLAEALHGNHQHYLRVDCGEFQLEHETAKLIGAPPGYLGHRETIPLLSQQKLNEATSNRSDISIVLFDEIEKAAPSLTRLLLGVLDKAILKLGDNTTVNFEHSLIFLTSNLGAAEMTKELRPAFGFEAGSDRSFDPEVWGKLESIALAAVRKRFSPEFVNRIDSVVTYQPLAPESLSRILDHQIADLQEHVNTKLGARCFGIEVTDAARAFLLERGTSPEYGARELKRVVHRFLMQPLATLVVDSRVDPGGRVVVEVAPEQDKLALKTTFSAVPVDLSAAKPTLLVVDDNSDLLRLLTVLLSGANWEILTAETAEAALALCAGRQPAVALIDYMLPDLNGLELSSRLQGKPGSPQIIIMTGGQLSGEEQEICREYRWLLVQKPFIIEDLIALIQSRIAKSSAVKRAI